MRSGTAYDSGRKESRVFPQRDSICRSFGIGRKSEAACALIVAKGTLREKTRRCQPFTACLFGVFSEDHGFFSRRFGRKSVNVRRDA